MAITVAGLEDNLLCRLTLGDDGTLRHAQQTLAQPQKKTTPTGVVMALPAGDLIRRQLPKPFQKRRQLLRIAPAMTEDTLLNDEHEHTHLVQVVEDGLSPSLFTTYSVADALLTRRAESLGRYLNRIRLAVPTPHGLAYFAKRGENSIVLCARGQNVLAVLVSAKGALMDYRQASKDQWLAEGAMCLRTWLNHCAETTPLLIIGDVANPAKLDVPVEAVTLPASVTPALAPLYGIAMQLHTQNKNLPKLRIADTALSAQRTVVADRLLRIAGILVLASTCIAGALMYREHVASTQANAYASAVSTLFNDLMPNVPEVDPMLQVSKRLSQLKLFTGHVDPASQSFKPLDILNSVNTAAQKAGLSLKIERLEIAQRQFKLQGVLDSFSEAETFRTQLSSRLRQPLELKNAQTKAEGGVQFQLEGTL